MTDVTVEGVQMRDAALGNVDKSSSLGENAKSMSGVQTAENNEGEENGSPHCMRSLSTLSPSAQRELGEKSLHRDPTGTDDALSMPRVRTLDDADFFSARSQPCSLFSVSTRNVVTQSQPGRNNISGMRDSLIASDLFMSCRSFSIRPSSVSPSFAAEASPGLPISDAFQLSRLSRSLLDFDKTSEREFYSCRSLSLSTNIQGKRLLSSTGRDNFSLPPHLMSTTSLSDIAPVSLSRWTPRGSGSPAARVKSANAPSRWDERSTLGETSLFGSCLSLLDSPSVKTGVDDDGKKTRRRGSPGSAKNTNSAQKKGPHERSFSGLSTSQGERTSQQWGTALSRTNERTAPSVVSVPSSIVAPRLWGSKGRTARGKNFTSPLTIASARNEGRQTAAPPRMIAAQRRTLLAATPRRSVSHPSNRSSFWSGGARLNSQLSSSLLASCVSEAKSRFMTPAGSDEMSICADAREGQEGASENPQRPPSRPVAATTAKGDASPVSIVPPQGGAGDAQASDRSNHRDGRGGAEEQRRHAGAHARVDLSEGTCDSSSLGKCEAAGEGRETGVGLESPGVNVSAEKKNRKSRDTPPAAKSSSTPRAILSGRARQNVMKNGVASFSATANTSSRSARTSQRQGT